MFYGGGEALLLGHVRTLFKMLMVFISGQRCFSYHHKRIITIDKWSVDVKSVFLYHYKILLKLCSIVINMSEARRFDVVQLFVKNLYKVSQLQI